MPATDALIFDAVRTPRGRGKPDGALHSVKPIDLTTGLIEAVKRRNPGLDPADVDDIVMGIVSPVGEQGSVLPRVAAVAAGLPETVAGLQVDRFCASGLEAVNLAAHKIMSGMEDLVLAGGVESMSRVPMGSDGGAWAEDPATNYDTGFVPQGIGADLIATIEGFTRDDVDDYAVRSQELAARAWDKHLFEHSVVPVTDVNGVTVLDHDEHLRAGTTRQTLAGLRPSFAKLGAEAGFDAVALQKYHWVERIEHVHHAGNSSGIVDGATLMLIGNREAGERAGLTPRARIVATAVTGSDSTIMLTGPTPATQKVLRRAGLDVDDIDVFEVNEAFAAVPMKLMKDLGISIDKVNVNGGAIAMGHPLGATGAMILGTALDELERTGGRYALATLCVGGGMGIATVIERLGA
ncbi:acetyl-CoA C-acetyltransferase [Lapillicoccus jejuensis]|uniref:Acetyl-CoA C-acetyltransferase n=1 Tax=Lapillicoccus jejuensis TaxID=402171 RepID=A0A542E4Z5_9MICO|nr:acetyl-CoA C-acetyltransferase [Lapillicoccus jejuensis]TQJ10410.1 acetyl-CoA C-acetyltransferase [Lapillicoccus jejuensis]